MSEEVDMNALPTYGIDPPVYRAYAWWRRVIHEIDKAKYQPWGSPMRQRLMNERSLAQHALGLLDDFRSRGGSGLQPAVDVPGLNEAYERYVELHQATRETAVTTPEVLGATPEESWWAAATGEGDSGSGSNLTTIAVLAGAAAIGLWLAYR